MKRGLPLSARILLWALLNLLLLGLLAVGLFRGQFGPGLDSLIAGRAGDRLHGMGDVLAGELNRTPTDEWNSVVARTSAAYGLKLLVVRPDGLPLAGEPLELPAEVRQRLGGRPFPDRPPGEPRPWSGSRNNNPRSGQGTPPVRPPSVPESGAGAGSQPFFPQDAPPESRAENRSTLPSSRPGADPGLAGDPEGRPGREGRARFSPPPEGAGGRRVPGGMRPRFFLRAGEPTQYWAGVPLPGLQTADGRRVPAILLAVAPSLTAGGWIVDPVPWLWGGFGALLLSGLLWFPLVRNVTRSIRELTAATERMAEGRFDIPVQIKRADELGRLGTAVNHLSQRLDHFVHGQKRFLGDVAHELCSPLARMQLGASLMERDTAAAPELQNRVQDVQEEVELMTRLVDELLAFSKTGLKARETSLQPVAPALLAAQAAEREAGPGDRIELSIAPELRVLADPDLLSRALGNLVRNALRYAGSHGPVRLESHRLPHDPAHCLLTVRDSGPGVPPHELERIFEPFYRPDTARTREAGGTGLGLAIVRNCIDACQGTVSARNLEPSGLEVALRLRMA